MDQFLWDAANVLDVAHFVVIVPLLCVAMYFMDRGKGVVRWLARAFVMTTLTLQIAFVNCPLTVFTGWLRSFKEPQHYVYRTSVVHYIYAPLEPYLVLRWILVAATTAVTVRCVCGVYRAWQA